MYRSNAPITKLTAGLFSDVPEIAKFQAHFVTVCHQLNVAEAILPRITKSVRRSSANEVIKKTWLFDDKDFAFGKTIRPMILQIM